MYSNLTLSAKTLLLEASDKAHDVLHAQRVAENARIIADELEYGNADLLELCGWWHDVGRLIDNANHEKISADMLKKELLSEGFDETTASTAYQSVVFHKWNMKPETIEGQIIRDADKLDFISIERWNACLSAGQYEHLNDISELLPALRGMLHFPESKMLYDNRISSFLKSGAIERLP